MNSIVDSTCRRTDRHVSGHETLVNQGVLHRDMSPGNLYLGEAGCPEGWEGFVADLELASAAQAITIAEKIEHPPEQDQLNQRYDFKEKTILASSRGPGSEIAVRLCFFALWAP